MVLKAYFKTFKDGNKILCTTYLKTNLIYDLETNTAGINGARLNSFTEIFYHDYRSFTSTYGYISPSSLEQFNGQFDKRYIDFQRITLDLHPGLTLAPVMVDVMFEILSLNERKIQDSLNITDSIYLK